MATPVTPKQGTTVVITTGGAAVIAIPAGVNGGYVINPQLPADQGLSASESLYVDPTTLPGLEGNGTTAAITPGNTFNAIPNSALPLWVNAASSGHKFTAVYW